MDSHSVHQFLTDLKIIGPIKKPLKEFESPDEFNLYYHKHKEEMDSETTHSLNKKFKIDGFRITKIKGVLCLKKDRKIKPDVSHEEENTNHEILERLQKLEEVVNSIIDIINEETKILK